MLKALITELESRKSYLSDSNIQSIYFGGGTPSILTPTEIQRFIDQVAQHFDLASDAEITLEANPDDLTATKVKELRGTSVNRFSIGIQSFYTEDLLWMNRAHNAQEADTSIKRVQDAGFENITCDLIYGYPLLSNEKWQSNMAKLLQFGVPHISSYAMTVEHRTALAHQIKTGKTSPILEDQAEEQMLMLIDTCIENGYEQYEISNFAKDGMYAKHNTNYWFGKHYLGIGPSAHSFNGATRSWNIANNAQYIAAIAQKNEFQETESLSTNDRYNEYIMTALRTMWGVALDKIAKDFGADYQTHFLKEIEPFIERDQVLHNADKLFKLTKKGKLLADHIASELFFTEK